MRVAAGAAGDSFTACCCDGWNSGAGGNSTGVCAKPAAVPTVEGAGSCATTCVDFFSKNSPATAGCAKDTDAKSKASVMLSNLAITISDC